MNTTHRPGRRTTRAAIAGLLAAVTLSAVSCSTSGSVPTLTQVDATARLEAHFAAARQALHGRATFKSDDSLPPHQALPCDDNDNRSDAPVTVSRKDYIDVAAPEAQVISTLHQYWLGQGWKDSEHADSFSVGVTSPDGYRFYIGHDPTGLAITGTTPCAAKTLSP